MAIVLLGFWPARSRCECNLSRASRQQSLFPHNSKSLMKLHEFPKHLSWHQLVVEDFACLLSPHLLTGRSGAAMSFEASHTHTHTHQCSLPDKPSLCIERSGIVPGVQPAPCSRGRMSCMLTELGLKQEDFSQVHHAKTWQVGSRFCRRSCNL